MALIRLVATDVDGTLIGHDGVLPPDRRAAVGRLRDAGIGVVLATGKTWPSIRPLWDELELPGPHVACNGAAVVDAQGQLLASTPLDDAVAHEVVDALVARRIPHATYLDDGTLVTSQLVPELDVLVELGEPAPVEGELDGRRALKVLSVLAEPDEGDLRRLAAGDARIQRTSHRFLEWNHPDADKAHGLRFVVERLGIDIEEVVAIGDAENDVPMLRYAGTGVAVSAASDAALAGADLHLTTDLATYLTELATARQR